VRAAVLVPVKSFRHAKVRLASALDPARRAALAREMAVGVLAASRPLPVYVVCDDDEVARWASEEGANVLWSPERGLNGAVDDGVTALAAAGIDRVVVAHADLPLAIDLAWPAGHDGVTLVPDRHDDGTNVACVPAKSGFRFAYGPGSFRRHGAEARLATRAASSAPILAELEPWLRVQREHTSRKSEIGKAIDYTLKRWPALTRFMTDGRICLSNNAAERALRGIAVGRHNWTFAGSDRGGERAAAMYTLIETAKLNGVDPQAWLADVLARLPDHPVRRIADLLPWCWGRAQPPVAA